jgi:hypothetical protein
VGGDAGGRDVCAFQAGAGEGEPGAEFAAEPRQEPAAADIREEADTGLRHGEDGAFGGDAVRSVDGETDAAAHGNAVDQGEDRFREGLEGGVHAVFGTEEITGFGRVPCPAFSQHADVAAGAEAARSRLMIDPDQLDGRVCGPARDGLKDGGTHRRVEGVQGRGAGERDAAEAALLPDRYV